MKKPTKAELEQQLSASEHARAYYKKCLEDTEAQLQRRPPESEALKQRIQLMNSIGQMTEAIAHAIKYAVGGEHSI